MAPATYVGGMIASAVVIAAVGVLVMIGVGVALYGVEVQAEKVPMMIGCSCCRWGRLPRSGSRSPH